ncbi:hypothetical protein VYU27_006616 [Nannochloropsis oceanica]
MSSCVKVRQGGREGGTDGGRLCLARARQILLGEGSYWAVAVSFTLLPKGLALEMEEEGGMEEGGEEQRGLVSVEGGREGGREDKGRDGASNAFAPEEVMSVLEHILGKQEVEEGGRGLGREGGWLKGESPLSSSPLAFLNSNVTNAEGEGQQKKRRGKAAAVTEEVGPPPKLATGFKIWLQQVTQPPRQGPASSYMPPQILLPPRNKTQGALDEGEVGKEEEKRARRGMGGEVGDGGDGGGGLFRSG